MAASGLRGETDCVPTRVVNNRASIPTGISGRGLTGETARSATGRSPELEIFGPIEVVFPFGVRPASAMVRDES